MSNVWAGRKVQQAREYLGRYLPAPCARGCGTVVTTLDDMVLGHIKSRITYPELTWEPSNWQVECRKCSNSSAQAAVQEKAKFDALKSVGFVFPAETGPGQSPLLPAHTHGSQDEPLSVREGLSWDELCQDAPDWLKGFLDVPEDGSPPLWVSSVHPEAVGSYGPAAIEWMQTNLKERGKPLSLRWWQRLAIVLQLQHREDGTLCFRTIIESGPRRIGKSVRLRAMALWRLEHGPDLFEPEQLVLHTGKDLAIVREVMRKAWAWAAPRDGWAIKKGMTEPEVSRADVNRWVARSKDATTGYDACLALVDEAWDVKPASIDDDLEPTMLERESPQLVLTSTAHRRATSLMRGRIIDALTVDDGETLLLIWGAPSDADQSDPAVWRAASPHWSEDRAQMMESKYAKALAGENDPEFDDPDPLAGFGSQYLNRWVLRQKSTERGTAVTSEQVWDSLTAPVPDAVPSAVAVESGFAEGVSLALCWKDTKPVVTVIDCVDVADAVSAIKEVGFKGRVLVGASIADDPAFAGMRTDPMKGRTLGAVQDLTRLLSEDAFRHDGGEFLRTQILQLRTLPGADGPRMSSQKRADAVKSAMWAINAVRANSGKRITRILLPTN